MENIIIPHFGARVVLQLVIEVSRHSLIARGYVQDEKQRSPRHDARRACVCDGISTDIPLSGPVRDSDIAHRIASRDAYSRSGVAAFAVTCVNTVGLRVADRIRNVPAMFREAPSEV